MLPHTPHAHIEQPSLIPTIVSHCLEEPVHLMQLLINMHPMAQKMKKPQSAYFHARAVMELAMTPSTEDGIFLAKNLRLGDRKWATIAGADAIVDEFICCFWHCFS